MAAICWVFGGRFRQRSTVPTACIQIERCDDGFWEFAVWLEDVQIVLGCRDTQEEAYAAACALLTEAEAINGKQ